MPNELKIDRALLEHLAELARLNVPSDRQPVLRRQLQQLVEAFSALGEAPACDPAAPLAPPHPLRLRPDRAELPLSRDLALANAPQVADGSFVVPRVVDP